MANNKTALVVDDSLYIRTALCRILEAQGFTVVATADNGVDAIARYMQLKPDLVTMDVIMPRLSGLQALLTLKGQDPSVCVVMVTSLASHASVTDCLKAGARNYLLKPFDPAKVAEVLGALFPQQEQAALQSVA